jgi:hypothetical protein
MNLARPFKAGLAMQHRNRVASATLEPTVQASLTRCGSIRFLFPGLERPG